MIEVLSARRPVPHAACGNSQAAWQSAVASAGVEVWTTVARTERAVVAADERFRAKTTRRST
ncbi:hypothetical protein, partial [Streptomyces phaeochromogenes]|uniref:hypothetical protein n=1 Tax=Streptomyces phaeochromogenes TaxID=1923 RepID=UPI001FDFFFED